MKSFPFTVRRAENRFMARCASAGIIVYGDTAPGAEAKLREALERHLQGGKKRRAPATNKQQPPRPRAKSLPRASRKLPF